MLDTEDRTEESAVLHSFITITFTQSVCSSPWYGYHHMAIRMHGELSICHDSMTALLKLLHCNIHHPKCTTANSRETQRKLCSAHNIFQWCYMCVEYRQTTSMWKMWWLCPPLFAGSNLPCLNGNLCIREGLLASIDNGLCHYHSTLLCLCNSWWLLPLTSVFLTLILPTWRVRWAPNNASKRQTGFNSAFKGLNTNCRKCICIGLPYYYYWNSFFFALVTTFSCPVTNASHPRRLEFAGYTSNCIHSAWQLPWHSSYTAKTLQIILLLFTSK